MGTDESLITQETKNNGSGISERKEGYVSQVKDKKKEPFVSVLTPVYNGEKYLEECIQSVLKQNYSNWEYVIVNNKSTDNSGQIICKYARKDKRIRVHNNEKFLPVMKNLNHAFRQISPHSKYCKVIHADDFMFENCLTKMVSVAEKHPTIGVVSSYRLANKELGLYGLPYSKEFNDGAEIGRDYLLDNSYYFGSPSTLLLRSSLIRERDKIYDESHLSSDISACLDMLKESDFGFVHQILTFSRRHQNSVTNTIAKKDSTYIYGYLKIYLDYAPYYLKGKELEKQTQRRISIFYIQFARQLLYHRNLETYRRHKKELALLGLPFNHIKLLKQIIKEMIKVPVIHFLKKRGVF